jgi:predicted metal-dependent hydrolase
MEQSPTDLCKSSPSPTLHAAIRQFNAGAYFACHETLEELWRDESGPLREFYQGVLQIAVGLNHLLRGNEAGAVALLARGSGKLRPFMSGCLGVDVAALLVGAEQVLRMLETQGLERTQAQAPELFPRIVPTVSG